LIGHLRQDDDGHWYLIPSLFVTDFDEMMDKMDGIGYLDNPCLFDEFEEFFGRFRIDNPYSVRCILDEEYY